MKRLTTILFSILVANFTLSTTFAEEPKASADISRIEKPTANLIGQMKEDTDGKIEANEYRVLTSNGGLTRRPCPYTCEMRGIPRNVCHEFRSIDGTECYVEDHRLPDDALPK